MNAKHLIILAVAALGLGLLSPPASAAPPAKTTPHVYTIDVSTQIAGATDTFVASLAATGKANRPYVLVGSYLDPSDGSRHGFIGHLTSAFTLADATAMAAPAGSSWTYPTSVNRNGTSVGFYLDPGTGISYGFIRPATGILTTGLAAPGADTTGTATVLFESPPTYGDPAAAGTFPEQITDAGLVVGFYTVTDGAAFPPLTVHGFAWANSAFIAPIDDPGAQSTMAMGVTPGGMGYGNATVPNPTVGGATGKGLTVTLNHNGNLVYTHTYVDTAVPEPLPVGYCGWTVITGATDTGFMVGNAGNGCAIYGYAWTWSKGKFTNFAATNPTGTPAGQTLITGATPKGIIFGAYETGWTGPWGGWLSPSNYAMQSDGTMPRAGFGYWHGFIQTTN